MTRLLSAVALAAALLGAAPPVSAQQKAAGAANPNARPVTGDIEGIAYSGAVSADRSVCSYVASVSNVVFVTNSRKQIENLVRTAQGKTAALNSQDEYVFFRQRYPRASQDETALLVLSDDHGAVIQEATPPKR